MEIPDVIRTCVGFVGVRTSLADPIPVGTFFYVVHDNAGYVVTAAHVFEGVRAHSRDALLYLRINLAKTGSIWASTPLTEWVAHSDLGIDLVACPIVFEPSVVDLRAFPMASAATRPVVQQHNIGLGDEVFLTGLFVRHYGLSRNIPIVRTGAIAAMPEEPVPWRRPTPDGPKDVEMEAYLIEARSIGGLSGSPVFAYVSNMRAGSLRLGVGPQYFLLGVMHGHWDAPPDETPQDLALTAEMKLESVNMGIGIVVPVDALLDLLNREPFASARAMRDEVGRRATESTRDSASSTADGAPPAAQSPDASQG